ncbi:chaplin family protein [Dactylosporangium sp. NPDC051485]|uniref:chaplin family protein n=1 Tax=Dactylosporangium sp. NPDC051485 TaxID=3154846 RepID=UPI0034477C82
MKTWVRKSLNVGVLSAGFLLVSGGAAHADWTSGYNAGLLNGNQFDTTLQVPVNVCGNSIAVLGFADAHCGGGAAAVKTESASATESATTEDWTTGYNAGVANGNQLDTTLQVPVNISGNAVSVLGFSSASSSGGATAVKGGVSADRDNDGHGRRHHRGGGNGNNNGGYNGGTNGNYATEGVANRTEDWTSGYNAGLLNGNQLNTTAQLPINISGNAIGLLGFAGASSQGGAWAVKGESAQATESNHTTGYNAGLLNGNQADTTLQLPINLCGNSIAILGFASANCGGGATAVKGDVNGAGQGGGHGHGHGHHGGGNGQGNGGYGNGSNNGDDGYGPDANANNNAYPHSSGNASGVKANHASAKAHMHKAKTSNHKSASLDEHAKKQHKGTGAGLSPASDNGYGGGSGLGDDSGYGNGQNNGGYGNGSGNGDDDNHGRRHHRHHGDGNGWSNGGGATAVKGGCGDWTTGFNAGLLNGNQLNTTVQVPVNISGNAISLLGFSNASSSGGALAYSC